MITKPMLAGTAKALEDLTYPLIASPKLDGIRCLKVDGKIVSRSFKPIANDYIRKHLEVMLPNGADGEIMVGTTFQECTSAVMSRKGEPSFIFWMFDLVDETLTTPYIRRLNRMQKAQVQFEAKGWDRIIKVVPTTAVMDVEQLRAFEVECLSEGHEGVMVRAPDSPYKCGRSTLKQGYLLKVKQFKDSEAEIIGFVEQMENTNEATKDELGHTKRSSSKAGKVGKGTLGKFLVRERGDAGWEVDFKIGTGEGLTDELRQKIWNDRESYRGRIVKYKYQDIGSKDAPRIPIYLGFRDERDL